MADVTDPDPPLDPEEEEEEDPQQPEGDAEADPAPDAPEETEEDFVHPADESELERIGKIIAIVFAVSVVVSIIGATQRTRNNQGSFEQSVPETLYLGLQFILPYVLMLSSINFIVLVFRMILRSAGSGAQSGESQKNLKDGAPRDLLQWIWSKISPTEEGVGRVYDPSTLKTVQATLYAFTFVALASVVYECSERPKDCVTEALYDFPYGEEGRGFENLSKGVERVRYGESGAPEKKKIDTYADLAKKVQDLEATQKFAKEESPQQIRQRITTLESKLAEEKRKATRQVRGLESFARKEAEEAQARLDAQTEQAKRFESEFSDLAMINRRAKREEYDAAEPGVFRRAARAVGLDAPPSVAGRTEAQQIADQAEQDARANPDIAADLAALTVF